MDNQNQYSRGSEWRKWDLHVHTPYSIASSSFGDPNQDSTWKAYFEDLEKLPHEIKVLGINDYLFLDGYKKVLAYKERGGLKNIDLLLPVIEFRIKEFVGHAQMKRINYHIIFADQSILKPEVIEQQFLNQLYGKAILDEGSVSTSWGGAVTRDSLSDLGAAIRTATPIEKRADMPNGDLELGFNNINFALDSLEDILESTSKQNTYLKDNFFKAIGKSEWEDYRWSGSIAGKKTIINGCHFVFAASETSDKALEAKKRLNQQGVNDRLLHCSDAHALSSHPTAELRIGRCFTWIKADTTFEGLRQAIFEQDRIFLGEEPPILSAIRTRPTKFIRSLAIDKIGSYDQSQGTWFNKIEFALSPELVSIIGNKGSGKSAIADILGLIGNTPNHGHFSFLSDKKFKKGNLAGKFQATLTWVSGGTESKVLNENVDLRKPETIKYLPQNYFENLCNDLNDETFSKELEEVVFSHLSTDKKLDQKTFADLINYKSQNINSEIYVLKSEIAEINRGLVLLESEAHPDYKTRIENLKKQKEIEIAAHEKNIPTGVPDPSKETGVLDKQKQDIDKITKINGEISSLEEQKNSYVERYNDLVKELEDLRSFKLSLELKEKDVLDFQETHSEIAAKYFVSWDKLFTLKVNYKQVDSTINEKEKKLAEYRDLLIPSESLDAIDDEAQKLALSSGSINLKIERKIAERDALKQSLDIPTRKYQAYLEVKTRWEVRKNELIGDEDTNGTLKYLDARIAYLNDSLPALIQQEREKRLEKAVLIFNKKKEIVEIYQTIKDSIDAIIRSNQNLLNEYKIVLNTGFVFSDDFETRFFSFVNQQVKGSFRGVDEGRKALKATITDVNLDNVESVKAFLNKLITLLEEDQRSEVKEEERQKYITDQIADQTGFFDYLFSLEYFTPKYQLQLDAKNIDTLSPGERGALLLAFYLMLDKNDIPLIIDQPEDNLDNKSVSRILVPFIKQAKQRRQIIMVTHNPNLAVVADAEQIIYVNIDKANGNAFSSSAGAIENPEMNKRLVDILEGTRPAFDKRRLRYKQNES